jgi:hypothetical protein
VSKENIYIVINAGCVDKDLAHLNKYLDAYKVSSPPSRWKAESKHCSSLFMLPLLLLEVVMVMGVVLSSHFYLSL